jgi:hypothetical protein
MNEDGIGTKGEKSEPIRGPGALPVARSEFLSREFSTNRGVEGLVRERPVFCVAPSLT